MSGYQALATNLLCNAASLKEETRPAVQMGIGLCNCHMSDNQALAIDPGASRCWCGSAVPHSQYRPAVQMRIGFCNHHMSDYHAPVTDFLCNNLSLGVGAVLTRCCCARASCWSSSWVARSWMRAVRIANLHLPLCFRLQVALEAGLLEGREAHLCHLHSMRPALSAKLYLCHVRNPCCESIENTAS